jgi:hypothetical protein
VALPRQGLSLGPDFRAGDDIEKAGENIFVKNLIPTFAR